MKKSTIAKLCLGASLVAIALLLFVCLSGQKANALHTQKDELTKQNAGAKDEKTQFERRVRVLVSQLQSSKVNTYHEDVDAIPASYPDTKEKQDVMRIVIQANEDMRQALSRQDLPALIQVIGAIENGQLEELKYELPLLHAAKDCLEDPGQEAKENAMSVLESLPGSRIRKLVRRICESS